jgi:DnaA family protein
MTAMQLPLGLGLRDEMTFDSYCVGVNQHVLTCLRDMLQGTGESFIYLWGEHGVGRTHLLQACCHALDSVDLSTLYLPLAEAEQLSPDMLEGMESMDLICLDSINAVVGQRPWEEAIFHLYNRALASNTRLIIASDVVPGQLPCLMPDLKSRLTQGLVLQVKSLADDEKLAALQLRAQRRGLSLSDEVGQYLLRHYPRNMTVLFEALEQLDHASLVEQRRLTIPFVKQVLG